MLDTYKLEIAKPMGVCFTQMYNYIKLGFCLGSPYDMNFEVTLSDRDIDLIIEKLKEAKKQRSVCSK